jgi:serine/threonine protein kinase
MSPPAPTSPPSPEADSDPSRVRELVAECLDRFDDEGSAAIEAVCAAHPGFAPQIRARIETLEQMGLLTRETEAGERFPERLGEFRLIRRLGGGGMGVVFLAEQTSLGRPVALKVVRPGELLFGQARERFRREAQLIATLRHPGIVPVYAFGEAGDLPYYAMELVDGASLEVVLDALRGRDPAALTAADFDEALARATRTAAEPAASPLAWVPFCLGLVQQVAEALAHAHECGVVHRDVKPSNVMVTRDRHVRLVDFGLSTRANASKITRSGSELGSLPYMPPELLRGGMAAVDARSDVYSLGVTLYELLTLRAPFEAGDHELTRRAILAGAPRRPRDLNRALPADAEAVCLAALEADPADRYATAAAFARDLGNVVALRPIDAKPASAPRRLLRWTQRNPARAVATALALVVLVGGPLGFGAVQHFAAQRERALNHQLEGKRADLAASLANENRERTRAETNYERAKRAVTELLSDVSGDELPAVPQMEPVRAKLLEKAIAFYREMQVEAPGDPRLEFESARAGRTIGDLLVELGRYDEAQREYEHSIARLRPLVAAHPGDVDDRDALAGCLGQLAELDETHGRTADAQARRGEALSIFATVERDLSAKNSHSRNYVVLLLNTAQEAHFRGDDRTALAHQEVAVDVARKIHALDPASADFAGLLGDALASEATSLNHLGRGDDCMRVSREAYALFEKALAAAPTDRRLRRNSMMQACNFGLHLLTGPDADEAERVLRRGFEQAEALVRDFPANPELKKDLAVVAINYGEHLASRGRRADGLAALDRSIELLEELVAADREASDYPGYLAVALTGDASVRLKLGDVDAAEPRVKRALELVHVALVRRPGDSNFTAARADALFVSASVRRARGDLDGASQSIDEGLALPVARPDVLYDAVEALGACAAAADAANDETLLQSFVARGLATLRRAVQSGFRDAGRLHDEDDLAPLRADPTFETIVAAIPAAAPH